MPNTLIYKECLDDLSVLLQTDPPEDCFAVIRMLIKNIRIIERNIPHPLRTIQVSGGALCGPPDDEPEDDFCMFELRSYRTPLKYTFKHGGVLIDITKYHKTGWIFKHA